MKAIASLIMAAGLAVAALPASGETRVSVSYGAAPAMNYVASYHNHRDFKGAWGTVNAEVDHALTDRLLVGVSYTFSSSAGLKGKPAEDISATWHSLLANVRFRYLTTGSLTVYGRAGIGVLIDYYTPSWADSYNCTSFAFQFSPIGIDWSFTPHFAAFVEAGFGVQGVAQAGLRVGF